MKVELKNYNQNSARNANMVTIGQLNIYFSYETPIAFVGPNDHAKSENLWGPTTGKHLNWAPGGERIDRGEFEKRLEKAIAEAM